MILMIDNYDSFTYNLVQYLGELGADVETVRNDAVSVDQIAEMQPAGIVISPGPCTPNEAGISVELVQRLGAHIPMFGVCLGHQCIGQAFGAKVVRARRIMHGKTSMISHEGDPMYDAVDNPFEATRYHSLVLENDSVPDCLQVTSWTEFEGQREIMGLRHAEFPLTGVQFHPESILTRAGHTLLRNFLRTTREAA
ncbi:MAG: aminodeoxychorismate/anthranilate synthase component II [Gammaproteobacteria bacterium]|nr:aminodeoxychorismate/anthranilate synthase component II [Gammaproteobacteria bacterium]NNE04281.1 aminodeoxychorismate/anthranilate synthase component II [Xanthomonadales bacterium]